MDLTNLNKWVKRERHILPDVDQSLAMLSDATLFTKLDERSGFALDRLRLLKSHLPHSLLNSGDIFNRL